MPPSPRDRPNAVRAAPRPVLLAAALLSMGVQGGPCADAQATAPATAATAAATPSAPVRQPDDASVTQAAAAIRAARAFETRAAARSDSVGRWDPALADSARLAYERAAALVPAAADWLRLRTLALEPDAAQRVRVRQTITVPAAQDRIGAAEASARTRAGDLTGAAGAWAALGADATAAALRARAAARSGDVAGQAAARGALATLVRDGLARGGSGPDSLPSTRVPGADRADLREAATILDSAFAPLPAPERLLVARALTASGGTTARAVQAYAAARDAGLATPADLAALADGLARLGRWREAAAQWERVVASGDRALAPAAGFQAARALLRAGDGGAARARLARVIAEWPGDGAAASARYLRADLAVDDGRDADARAGFREVARMHPESPWAPQAAFRGALIALTAGESAPAAAELDSLARRWPASDERWAATYWAGRAWSAAGEPARAADRWRAVVAGDPGSYYAGLASRRLSQAPWTPPAGDAPAVAASEQALAAQVAARAGLLERLGMGAEAGFERDWLTRWAESAVARQLTAAAALVQGGRPGPSIRLAARALARGAPRSAETYRLLFPLLYGDALRREAAARGIEPALAAALVKQESNFTADAVSGVGARGLMQLMPDVGRSLWRASDVAARGPWSPALLFEPDVNLALGMRHLQAALGSYPHPAYALAAYNAGASRVRRWRASPGGSDPELFVERIPYEETRDYVRIVLGARDLYRALYPSVLATR